jgi:hypothetical protein
MMTGGLAVTLKIRLFGRSPSATLFVLTINGRQRPAVPLSSLQRTETLPAPPRASSLSLTCGPATVGDRTTVGGALSPSGPRVPVTLTFAGPNGATVSATATTTAGGHLSSGFTPTSPGTWTATATFAGDRTRRAASSRACQLIVAKRTSSIALTCPAPGSTFSPVHVSGTLAPPQSGVSISLVYTAPSGGVIVDSSAKTGAGGAFSDSSVTPGANQPGKWSVSASWPGDATTLGESASCTFTVS